MSGPSERLVITSAQNPRIKAAAALRERKERERTGLVLVEGAREIGRALAAGHVPDSAFVCEELARAHGELVGRLERALGSRLTWVSPHAFDKLALREGSDGIVVVLRRPEVALEAVLAKGPALVLAVHGVEKPGNLGALLRTADGVGASGVVVLESSVDPYAPQSIRASLGTVFTQPVVVASSAALRALCEARGVSLYAAALGVEARRPWQLDLRGPSCVVLGAEATGLPAGWLDAGVTRVEIPMRGAADSLNVAAAGAMLLYEALRQRAS